MNLGCYGLRVTQVPPQQTPHRILIVEDNAAISDIAATALRYSGHAVTQSADGLEALRLARSTAFDLAVLDVMLPGIDGLEVCRRLRNDRSTMPILFLLPGRNRMIAFAVSRPGVTTTSPNRSLSTSSCTGWLRYCVAPTPPPVLSYCRWARSHSTPPVSRRGAEERSSTSRRQRPVAALPDGESRCRRVEGADPRGGVSDDYTGSENVVELYIGYLRRKLDDGHPPLIHTRRGIGYVLREEAQ